MSELVVMARIAGRRCAFRADDVQSVIELGQITPVPCAPCFVEGITALRSQTLTVLDARRAIGLETPDACSDDRAVVVSVAGFSYALMVDEIEDVTPAIAETGEIPGGFGENWARVCRGMVETRTGPALLVDLATLVAGTDRTEAAA
ncbi:MAG: chemotaxis protein CheW [Erythrobacter sp.]